MALKGADWLTCALEVGGETATDMGFDEAGSLTPAGFKAARISVQSELTAKLALTVPAEASMRLATRLPSNAERAVQPRALLTCPDCTYAQISSFALDVVKEALA